MAWHAVDLLCSDCIGALATAAASFGANVVVHGAGVPSFGPLQSLAPGNLQRVLHTNLLAPMLLTQALLPHLRSLPGAQVLFVGSALGRLGLPGFSVYSASKFGLRGFAEALRRELADSAVRVQYLGPRSTRTAFNDAAVEAYNRATGTAMDDPQIVADALLRLLRDDRRAELFVGWPEKLAVRLNAPGAELARRGVHAPSPVPAGCRSGSRSFLHPSQHCAMNHPHVRSCPSRAAAC